MSYLSLLCALQGGGRSTLTEASRAAENAVWLPSSPDGAETTGAGAMTSRPGDFALPSGVRSMQHWLDLNA
jgi:hypothetical protein